jgi:hypothetical protein
MTGATSGAGTDFHSGAHELSPGVSTVSQAINKGFGSNQINTITKLRKKNK